MSRSTDCWHMQEAFEGKRLEEHGKIWDHAWKENRTTWDRGGPSLALYETLKEYPELFNGGHPDLQLLEDFVGHDLGQEAVSQPTTAPPTKRRKKALVPACGKGYDAVLLAYVFGYDVWALDISEAALLQATQYMASVKDALSGRSPPANESAFWSSITPESLDGPGHIKYILGDFFSHKWNLVNDMKFDLIFDYTVSSSKQNRDVDNGRPSQA